MSKSLPDTYINSIQRIGYQGDNQRKIIKNPSTNGYIPITEFGGIGDEFTDNYQAFVDGIAYCRKYGLTLYIPPGEYLVSDTISWTHDNSVGMVSIKGAGPENSIIRPTDNTKNVFEIYGQVAAGYYYISQFRLESFAIKSEESYSSMVAGIKVGKANDGSAYYVDGFNWNIIYDVFVENMPIGFSIYNARHINLESCVVRSNVSVSGANYGLYVWQNDGQFTGDMNVNHCEFVAPAVSPTTQSPICLYSYGVSSEVRGIHFTNCICYYGKKGTYLFADALGNIKDVWFNTCAWDGPSYGYDGVYLSATGAFLQNVQFVNPYIVNWSNDGMTITCTGDYDNIAYVNVNGGYIGLCTNKGVNIYAGENCTVTGVNFVNIRTGTSSGSSVITLSGSGQGHVITANSHNIASGSVYVDYMVDVGSNQVNYVVTGNYGNVLVSGVNDQANNSAQAIFNNYPGWNRFRLGVATVSTISSDTIARQTSYHTLCAESGTTDDLDAITGGLTGDMIFLQPDSGDTITIKHNNAGSDYFITTDEGDIALDNYDMAWFVYNGSIWMELGRNT